MGEILRSVAGRADFSALRSFVSSLLFSSLLFPFSIPFLSLPF
jgi:hypothetical protein